MADVPEPVLLPVFLLAAVGLYSCSGDDIVLLFWQWLKASPRLEERSGQEVWGIVPFLQELLFPSCMPATPRRLSVLLSVPQSFVYGRLFLGEDCQCAWTPLRSGASTGSIHSGRLTCILWQTTKMSVDFLPAPVVAGRCSFCHLPQLS